MDITIALDNDIARKGFQAAWGFSAWIPDEGLLFDTGPDGQTLFFNLMLLGIHPSQITKVVLSHIHRDHTGGLMTLLGAVSPEVYVPPSFPEEFKEAISHRANVVEVSAGDELGDQIFSTGEMGSDPFEQGLVIRTDRGIVVMTGCAHPGIVQMVSQARRLFGEVDLVVGGFHLLHKQDIEIDQVIEEFRDLGVKRVAPCHCTGSRALGKLSDVYGNAFVKVGSGKVMDI
jgi:7,8-dihydropterin-6-yl-methyl-4-(beta-D-ribofuranosyl)aminobenzene 5'-phosphate synthase